MNPHESESNLGAQLPGSSENDQEQVGRARPLGCTPPISAIPPRPAPIMHAFLLAETCTVMDRSRRLLGVVRVVGSHDTVHLVSRACAALRAGPGALQVFIFNIFADRAKNLQIQQ